MLSGVYLVGNLGTKPDDVRAMPEQSKRLLSSPHGTCKGAGLVNPLNTVAADRLDNMKKPADEGDFGRLGNKETGFKIADHRNAVLSKRGDSATRQFDERSLSAVLTQINEARVPVLAQTDAATIAPCVAASSPVRPDTP